VELLRVLHHEKKKLDEVHIEPEHFIALLKLVYDRKITELQAKQILNSFIPKSFMPQGIVGKITNVKELEKVAREVVGINSKAADDYRAGEKKSFDFLMGEVMKATQKRADFKVAREVLEKILR
jgi:aspartyl-tRNA(Asn)/glutamyl-tRNA(Gln) amidotransferase subunit B